MALENRSSLGLLLSQPISGGVLTGLVLGAPGEGLFIGALLQMIFLGFVSVRGLRIPDIPVGAVAGAALYILSGRALGGDPSLEGFMLFWAILTALFVSGLGGSIYKGWETVSWRLFELAGDYIREGKMGRASAVHLSTLLFHFLYAFVVLLIGVPLCRMLVVFVASRLHAEATGPLGLLLYVLPLIGAGRLMQLHMATRRIFWFGAGFLASYVFLIVRG